MAQQRFARADQAASDCTPASEENVQYLTTQTGGDDTITFEIPAQTMGDHIFSFTTASGDPGEDIPSGLYTARFDVSVMDAPISFSVQFQELSETCSALGGHGMGEDDFTGSGTKTATATFDAGSTAVRVQVRILATNSEGHNGADGTLTIRTNNSITDVVFPGDAGTTFQGTGTAATVFTLTGDTSVKWSATGTCAAVIGASGNAGRTRQGTGTSALVVAATGDATKKLVGAGTSALVVAATGDATKTSQGTGTAATVFTVVGDATRTTQGTATAATVFTLTGNSTVIWQGTGTAATVVTVTGNATIAGGGGDTCSAFFAECTAETYMWGLGVVQEIDAAAMSLWLTYRNIEADVKDVRGGSTGSVPTEDFQYAKFGALINF